MLERGVLRHAQPSACRLPQKQNPASADLIDQEASKIDLYRDALFHCQIDNSSCYGKVLQANACAIE